MYTYRIQAKQQPCTYFNVQLTAAADSPRLRTSLSIHSYLARTTYLLDVLWGQPIKLIQVVSTSEFHEY